MRLTRHFACCTSEYDVLTADFYPGECMRIKVKLEGQLPQNIILSKRQAVALVEGITMWLTAEEN